MKELSYDTKSKLSGITNQPIKKINFEFHDPASLPVAAILKIEEYRFEKCFENETEK